MTTEQISIRVDKVTKALAEKVLRQLGLSPTDAVRMFYRQIVLRRGLPFAVKIPNAETEAALRELDEGKGRMSKDTKSFYGDIGI
ncbi:MAG TPA: type II toxin-antitoxin system RelB/DinJ family antitoxin [Alphaproteobacteria bacterium]|nr:type II toxin-antitoxin system RelB/DinJ family antitoxin [Alphaproteobacteria bacterium]